MNVFLSTLRMIVLFLALPFTRKEWPWVDPDEAEPQEKSPSKQQEENDFQVRLANSTSFFMQGVFVLMTTNYTLNPSFYYLGAQTSGPFTYFPIFQIALATIYACLKIYTS